MNSNYVVSLSKGTALRYLTMSNQRGQSRIMCFQHKKDALRCKEYVIGYKTAYGHWPSLDMSETTQQVKFSEEKIESNDGIYQELYVSEIDCKTIEYFCVHKKLSFLLCNSFDTSFEGNKHVLNFSGAEYICDNDDFFGSIQHLDSIYKNS